MIDASDAGPSRDDLSGLLVDDPMSIDPAYFFDAPRPASPQVTCRWLYPEEVRANDIWQEDGEELFNAPFPRVMRLYSSGSRSAHITYPYPWLAEPEG